MWLSQHSSGAPDIGFTLTRSSYSNLLRQSPTWTSVPERMQGVSAGFIFWASDSLGPPATTSNIYGQLRRNGRL